MKSKFQFYDVVKIISENPKHVSLKGKLAVIRGKVKNEETGVWSYGVSLYKKESFITRFYEEELEFVKKRADPRDFHTSESIKIRVDPETGEGEIVDDDNEK